MRRMIVSVKSACKKKAANARMLCVRRGAAIRCQLTAIGLRHEKSVYGTSATSRGDPAHVRSGGGERSCGGDGRRAESDPKATSARLDCCGAN